MTLDAKPDARAAKSAVGALDGVFDEHINVGVLHEVGDAIAGRYRLTALLGRGGMGDVWRAHDETLDIDVALKVIRPEDDADDSEDRLLREAQIAARLGHPAIVRISDFGRSELDEPFIVMELLEGTDLGTALKARGQIRPDKAVRVLLPVIHALSAAHAKGIVHRDVKPDNIFIARLEDEQFQPKIVDFGIAKIERVQGGGQLTKAGALIGSPKYMAPEQARGERVDQRADVWSTCVVLYEMIVGEPPFRGANSHALLYAIMIAEPEPMPIGNAAEAALWEIIAHGLAKDADERIQTARELGARLAEWLIAQGITEDITGASIEGIWRGRTRKLDSIAPVAGLDVSGIRSSMEPTLVDQGVVFGDSPTLGEIAPKDPLELALDLEDDPFAAVRARRRRAWLLASAVLGASLLGVGVWTAGDEAGAERGIEGEAAAEVEGPSEAEKGSPGMSPLQGELEAAPEAASTVTRETRGEPSADAPQGAGAGGAAEPEEARAQPVKPRAPTKVWRAAKPSTQSAPSAPPKIKMKDPFQ
jgi:eukaryotic-like serine/threonine-protein kinase